MCVCCRNRSRLESRSLSTPRLGSEWRRGRCVGAVDVAAAPAAPPCRVETDGVEEDEEEELEAPADESDDALLRPIGCMVWKRNSSSLLVILSGAPSVSYTISMTDTQHMW